MKLFLLISYFIALTGFQTDPYTKASNLYDNQKFDDCIKLCDSKLNELKSVSGKYALFLRLRADAYRHNGNYKNAITDYKQLVILQPKDCSNYTNLSYVYGETTDYNSAVDILKQAMKVNERDEVILSNLAYYLNQTANYKEALIYVDKGLAVAKKTSLKSSLYNSRGYAYLKLKDYSEALVNINKAIGYDPENSFAYTYRALVNIELNRLDVVCDDLQKAKQLGGVNLTAELRAKYCKD